MLVDKRPVRVDRRSVHRRATALILPEPLNLIETNSLLVPWFEDSIDGTIPGGQGAGVLFLSSSDWIVAVNPETGNPSRLRVSCAVSS